jgi:hypothetical protein
VQSTSEGGELGLEAAGILGHGSYPVSHLDFSSARRRTEQYFVIKKYAYHDITY